MKWIIKKCKILRKIFKVYVIDTENYKLLLRDINNDLNEYIIEQCIIFLEYKPLSFSQIWSKYVSNPNQSSTAFYSKRKKSDFKNQADRKILF